MSYVLLDFDGTLTAPDVITDAFLADYRAAFLAEIGVQHAETWDRTLAVVRHGSPHLGWTLEGWEACPADADPYILASVVATRVLASVDQSEKAALANTLYASLYTRHAAPFRPEAAEVVRTLVARGHRVAIVSNASTGKIEARLEALFGADRGGVQIFGQARKFGVRSATRTTVNRARFDALPDFVGAPGLARPTWLRRGAFFDCLADIWGDDASGPEATIFCGDIWELDLALPSALGCAVHLVERAAPLATHAAERAAVAATPRAAFSADLRGLLDRV